MFPEQANPARTHSEQMATAMVMELSMTTDPERDSAGVSVPSPPELNRWACVLSWNSR